MITAILLTIAIVTLMALAMFAIEEYDKGMKIANTWEFTVKKPSIVEKILEAQQSEKRIKLTYIQWMQSPYSMDSTYEITEVEIQE